VEYDAASTIVVNGEIDIATTDSFVAQARPAFADARASAVTIDLAGVTFCDSVGLAALIRLRKLAEHHSRQLRVVNAQAAVRRVLDYAGLREYLHVE
jgi:anti-sigma B factor antagonist